MAGKTKYIGVGTTILTISALLLWFLVSDQFEISESQDIYCDGTIENPCISFINVTFTPTNPIYKYYYLYNKGDIKLDFSPEIKDYAVCKKDGRYKKPRSEENLCGPGYREILTGPYYYKYSYIYKFYKDKKEEWMIIGLKNNPSDTIKWGISVKEAELDPVWIGDEKAKPTDCNDVINCVNVNYWNITKNESICPPEWLNHSCYWNVTWKEFWKEVCSTECIKTGEINLSNGSIISFDGMWCQISHPNRKYGVCIADSSVETINGQMTTGGEGGRWAIKQYDIEGGYTYCNPDGSVTCWEMDLETGKTKPFKNSLHMKLKHKEVLNEVS